MKRAFTQRAVLAAVSLAAIAMLGGCPIYSHDDDGCWRDRDCASGFLCDDSSGVCYLPSSGSNTVSCERPSDCGQNETCSKKGRCVSGDCSFSGCVSGYACEVSDGEWKCISGATGSAGGSGMSGASGAAGEAGGG